MKKGPLFTSAMVALLVFFHVYGCKAEMPHNIHAIPSKPSREICFHKDGELSFVGKNGQRIVTIDIEIPKTDEEISTGLMFRHKMAETEGMLFGHEKMPIQFYWMKNTYIPLDMIFVDKTLEIVGIRKTATPLSEELIPVPADTQYTIEVNGGFCDRHGISVGDKIVK
ncbi:MAG: DUF192 domain-containing protein [Nitrospiraceae bacterium]|nr:DUF192 domain-containing protein [Nitrospiraceae bacterium]